MLLEVWCVEEVITLWHCVRSVKFGRIFRRVRHSFGDDEDIPLA